MQRGGACSVVLCSEGLDGELGRNHWSVCDNGAAVRDHGAVFRIPSAVSRYTEPGGPRRSRFHQLFLFFSLGDPQSRAADLLPEMTLTAQQGGTERRCYGTAAICLLPLPASLSPGGSPVSQRGLFASR